MTGLEKIIDRILSDAKENARQILEAAQTECAGLTAQYEAEAEEIRAAVADRAGRECEAVISKARSEAAMARRNILLSARTELLDRTFDRAREELLTVNDGRYRELLTALVTTAVMAEERDAKESAALGDEVAVFETFEIVLNAADREKFGEAVTAEARRALYGKVDPARIDAIRLSEETAEIDGGVILRYGQVEANSSLAVLLAEIRRETEGEIAALLFDGEAEESL